MYICIFNSRCCRSSGCKTWVPIGNGLPACQGWLSQDQRFFLALDSQPVPMKYIGLNCLFPVLSSQSPLSYQSLLPWLLQSRRYKGKNVGPQFPSSTKERGLDWIPPFRVENNVHCKELIAVWKSDVDLRISDPWNVHHSGKEEFCIS